jgi:UDP-N-acetylglucosamine acyltransferase
MADAANEITPTGTVSGDSANAHRNGNKSNDHKAAVAENGAGRNPRVQMPKVPFPPLSLPLEYEDICRILPHRYPFLLIDRIVELEPGVRCVGIKNVTANEEFFQGHFPGYPVMPGVLILESMAQVAGVLTLVSRNTPGALSYFAVIEKARFRQPVRPGDQLVVEVTLNVLRGLLCKCSVVGRVNDQIVVEAEYSFMTIASESSTTIAKQHSSDTPDSLLAPANLHDDSTVPAPPLVTPRSEAARTNALPHNPTTHTVPAVAASTRVPREGEAFVHPTAIVAPDAQIGQGVYVGPYSLVESGTSIGDGTRLDSHVVVRSGTSIGKRCRIWPHAILGGDPQDVKYRGEATFLEIGDDNIFREMVTIHRATGEGGKTIVGSNNLLMAYAHIGHNCVIGSNVMLSNSCGLSGHVTIEDKTVVGGFVGVHQFVHIGKMCMIGGLSKVVQDVPPFCTCDGRPAKVHGLNIRGLRRNGVDPETRNHVGNAFKLLYRSGLNTSQALDRIHAEIPRSETLDYFINFVERVRGGRLGRQDETPHF